MPKLSARNKNMRNINRKLRIKMRIRSKLKGTKESLRLSVFRSNKYLYAQLINDDDKKTVFGISEKILADGDKKETKTQKAKNLGLIFAKQALEKKIKTVIFDKGSYNYHGRIKAFADGAREGGLKF